MTKEEIWNYSPELSRPGNHLIFDEQGNHVANTGCYRKEVSEQKQIERAKLMAAAPEMLAALQAVNSGMGKAKTGAFKQVQDAIAKATGV